MATYIKELKKSVNRVDAFDKITGATKYLTDMDFGDDVLHAYTVRSTKARARIVGRNIPTLPEGYYIVDYNDVVGDNKTHMIIADWVVFAKDEVRFIGETIMLVVGPDKNKVYEIGKSITIDYEDIPPTFTIADSKALVGGAIHGEDNIFAKYTAGYGDVDKAFKEAVKVVENKYYTPHQEHLYMEVSGTVGVWENGKVALYSSTQCPFYVRHSVSPVLGVADEDLKVFAPPIGGGFGGKEHYADVVAATVAVAVQKLKRTVKCILDRHEDMAYSVKRQPSEINIKFALDKDNNITAVDIVSDMDGGAYEACSRIIMQRCTFTATGVYSFPNVRVAGQVYATNKPPSCAFRGFGAPQAIFAIERAMDYLAKEIGIDSLSLKKKYLVKKGDTTITGGMFHDNILLPELIDWAVKESDYKKKHKEYSGKMKGIGLSAFLHGCAFTGSGERDIIKAKLKMRKKKDKIYISTSNTEIGQGLHTAFRKIAAYELKLPIEQIEIEEYDTTKICDTGPTVASRSAMIVGYLVQEASKKMKAHLKEEYAEVEQSYEHPKHLIPWDAQTFRGDAYPSYGLGVNVVEVEIDKTTYEIEIKKVWGVFDTGYTIDKKVVDGQIIGGMAQALGWGFLERLDEKDGKFMQTKMSDYMIPTSLDLPSMKTHTIDEPYKYGPSGAKGIGELTFDGAAAALSSAIDNATNKHFSKIPITPEVLVEQIK